MNSCGLTESLVSIEELESLLRNHLEREECRS